MADLVATGDARLPLTSDTVTFLTPEAFGASIIVTIASKDKGPVTAEEAVERMSRPRPFRLYNQLNGKSVVSVVDLSWKPGDYEHDEFGYLVLKTHGEKSTNGYLLNLKDISDMYEGAQTKVIKAHFGKEVLPLCMRSRCLSLLSSSLGLGFDLEAPTERIRDDVIRAIYSIVTGEHAPSSSGSTKCQVTVTETKLSAVTTVPVPMGGFSPSDRLTSDAIMNEEEASHYRIISINSTRLSTQFRSFQVDSAVDMSNPLESDNSTVFEVRDWTTGFMLTDPEAEDREVSYSRNLYSYSHANGVPNVHLDPSSTNSAVYQQASGVQTFVNPQVSGYDVPERGKLTFGSLYVREHQQDVEMDHRAANESMDVAGAKTMVRSDHFSSPKEKDYTPNPPDHNDEADDSDEIQSLSENSRVDDSDGFSGNTSADGRLSEDAIWDAVVANDTEIHELMSQFKSLQVDMLEGPGTE